ncbi:MAG TPA: single-stranded DNA-binding protein, partial [Rhodocyclaceae bacterium]|nr:single-stranded DNA-binding protein [Rhodocyclaceae bacterium]
RETWQINARSVGILPFRIQSVTLSPKSQDAEPKPQAAEEPTAPKEPKRRK